MTNFEYGGGRELVGDFHSLIDSAGPDASRLEAVQGSSEARTKLYSDVQQGSTGANDTVMRQEPGQSSELASEAGQGGGGVW